MALDEALGLYYPYDLHTHTGLSDGHGTIRDNVRAAEACGMRMVAITDHYWGNDAALVDQIIEQTAASRADFAPRVLAGVEGYVLDATGRVSVEPETAGRLDLVLADMGGHTDGIGCNAPHNLVQALVGLVNAVQGMASLDHVDVWAHPFNLGRLDCPLSLWDLPREALAEMAAAMAEGNLVFEIMNTLTWWWPDTPVMRITGRYAEILALFAEHGVRFSMGSDAHRTPGVGNLRWSLRVARLAGLTNSHLWVPCDLA